MTNLLRFHHASSTIRHPQSAIHLTPLNRSRLELDEVDKGRVNVVIYFSDLVPLVPLNGAPLDKKEASAVRK